MHSDNSGFETANVCAAVGLHVVRISASVGEAVQFRSLFAEGPDVTVVSEHLCTLPTNLHTAVALIDFVSSKIDCDT